MRNGSWESGCVEVGMWYRLQPTPSLVFRSSRVCSHQQVPNRLPHVEHLRYFQVRLVTQSWLSNKISAPSRAGPWRGILFCSIADCNGQALSGNKYKWLSLALTSKLSKSDFGWEEFIDVHGRGLFKLQLWNGWWNNFPFRLLMLAIYCSYLAFQRG